MAEDGKSLRRKKIDRFSTAGEVPDVMDIKELSKYLGIGKSKIYALIQTKKIPASRIGRQYRFSKALIDTWLQQSIIMQDTSELPLFKKDKEAG
ncbi:MAG: helix-turn-helix domain-containing protein [Elusimicrobiota bacterium]